MIANNLTNEELANLQEQYQHVSTEYQRVMTENRKLRDAMAHLITDVERDLPCMNVLVSKRVRSAIERAKARVQS